MKANVTIRRVDGTPLDLTVEGTCGKALFQWTARALCMNAVSAARYGKHDYDFLDDNAIKKEIEKTLKWWGLKLITES